MSQDIFLYEFNLFIAIIIVERKRNLLHLPEAVDDTGVNRMLVGRCRCVVEPERFFLQRVQVIGQEHRTVIHFQLTFAVRLEIAYLVGRRLKYQLKNIPSAD